MTSLLLITLATTCAAMMVLWLISLWFHDASIVDIFWGLGFVAIAWTTYALTPEAAPRRTIVPVLVTLWGLRLSAYLAWRNLGHGEDHRYRSMRERYGDRFWIVSLGIVFMLQAGLMWIVSLPIQAVQWPGATPPIGWIDVVGIAIVGVGLAFETVADLQLARFRRLNDTRAVMDAGLWRYSRHPNYFGEFLVWCGFGIIAIAAGPWWTLVGPAVMTILLLKVSGVTLLERTIAQRRPGYEAYVARTNAFFPWPPRRSA